MKNEEPTLSPQDTEFIRKNRVNDRYKGLNPANHNTETKRYAKLSLSLTKAEKEKIEAYRDKHFPRTSISTIIINLLEKEGYFK
jgi:hypothetical protein